MGKKRFEFSTIKTILPFALTKVNFSVKYRYIFREGTRVSSKTLYNKKGIHIDVENPGHRPGQIHIQKDNAKYLYDVGKKAFVDKAGELAPKVFQKLLEDPKVLRAISKGLEILGY